MHPWLPPPTSPFHELLGYYCPLHNWEPSLRLWDDSMQMKQVWPLHFWSLSEDEEQQRGGWWVEGSPGLGKHEGELQVRTGTWDGWGSTRPVCTNLDVASFLLQGKAEKHHLFLHYLKCISRHASFTFAHCLVIQLGWWGEKSQLLWQKSFQDSLMDGVGWHEVEMLRGAGREGSISNWKRRAATEME